MLESDGGQSQFPSSASESRGRPFSLEEEMDVMVSFLSALIRKEGLWQKLNARRTKKFSLARENSENEQTLLMDSSAHKSNLLDVPSCTVDKLCFEERICVDL